MNEHINRYSDPGFVFGQVIAMRSLFLTLADLKKIPPTDLRVRGLAGFERVRAALLPSMATDATLAAIDEAEKWFLAAVPERR